MIGNPDALHSGALQEAGHGLVDEDAVVIMEQICRLLPKRRGLAYLLDHPLCGGMRRHRDVLDDPPIMADEHQHVEHLEAERRHGEEVHRPDGLPMIGKKRAPGLLGFFAGRHAKSRDILGDGVRGRHIGQSQRDQLIVNARWTPQRILAMHAFDQRDSGWRNHRPAARFGLTRPIPAEPATVPANHCGRGDDHQRRAPVRPGPGEPAPEPAKGRCRLRFWTFARVDLLLEECQLAAECQVLQHERLA